MFITDISLGQALLYSVVAILGVFAILLILVLCVNILSLIKVGKNPTQAAPVVATPANNNAKAFDASVVEKDEDMMAAVLVASVDFYNETKQNAKVVSVKQIN